MSQAAPTRSALVLHARGTPRLATHSELLRAGFTGEAEKPAKREAGRKCCQGPASRFNLLLGILICESRPG